MAEINWQDEKEEGKDLSSYILWFQDEKLTLE